ncbi:MAG: RNA-binding cell elongation regulator Jag/EloR [Anaerolineae bacterium]
MERRGESVEVRGKTVEEAIANGLAQLGLHRDQVEVEILSHGSRGLLGIGAEDALVRLTPLAGALEPKESVLTEEYWEGPEEEEAVVEAVKAPALDPREVERIARDALQGILQRMSIQARIVAKPPTEFMREGDNPPPVVLDIQGRDLGVLIGRRGETLGALQFLVRLIVNHRTLRWYNIVVDVQGYKERREQQLRRLAERMAEQVVATRRSVVLEAMPPYERRIVHLALRDHPKVTTHSIGEGENRKVMIHLRQ